MDLIKKLFKNLLNDCMENMEKLDIMLFNLIKEYNEFENTYMKNIIVVESRKHNT